MGQERVHLSVRVAPKHKALLQTRAEESGMELSIAVRQLLELAYERLQRGGDWIDALHELKTAWRQNDKG